MRRVSLATALPLLFASAWQPQKAAAVGEDAITEAGRDNVALISNNSAEIVGSLVNAFLAKEEMSKRDRECLVDGSQQFTDNLMQVAEHIVMLAQELLGQRSPDNLPGLKALPHVHLNASAAKAPDAAKGHALVADEQSKEGNNGGDATGGVQPRAEAAAAEEAPPPTMGRRLAAAAEHSGSGGGGHSVGFLMHLSSVLVEMGTSIQLLVKLSHHVADKCIDGEALEALETAARHARDVNYVAGHFLANGADVVTEFASSALQYKKGNYSGFGLELGTALRKIMLSTKSDSMLEGGMPGKYMMVNMSMGFVKGFFGDGFTLGVELDQDQKHPIGIDLEDCIANNLPFFEQIWSTMAFAYTKRQQDGGSGHAGQPGKGHQDRTQVQFGTAMAVAAMELPDALRRCRIGDDQADMLMDSVKAFGAGMHLTLSTPNELPSSSTISHDLGRTIGDWKKLEWYKFGFDLGLILQELVLSLFPQKYDVGDLGLLRQQLSALEQGTMGGNRGSLRLPQVLEVFTASLAVAAVAAVSRRDWWRLGGRGATPSPAGFTALDADTQSSHLERFTRGPQRWGQDCEEDGELCAA